MTSKLNKIATTILTVAGLFLLPSQFEEFTGATISGYIVSYVILITLSVGALFHLFPWVVLRRVGLGRYTARAILSKKIINIAVDERYNAITNTEKTMIFMSEPTINDLVDICETPPCKKITEKSYFSSDSTIRDIVRKNQNTLAIYWKPNERILPLVAYKHHTQYKLPGLYGSEAFFQAYHIDVETGLIETSFKCVHSIEYAVAFILPRHKNKLSINNIFSIALSGKQKKCFQPIVDGTGHLVKWTLESPKKYRTYVCCIFYKDGVAQMRDEINSQRLIVRIKKLGSFFKKLN